MKEQHNFSALAATSRRFTVVEDNAVLAQVDNLIAAGLLSHEVWQRSIDEISALTSNAAISHDEDQGSLFVVLQIDQVTTFVVEVLVGSDEASIVQLSQAAWLSD